jgi:hypothetical protein
LVLNKESPLVERARAESNERELLSMLPGSRECGFPNLLAASDGSDTQP